MVFFDSDVELVRAFTLVPPLSAGLLKPPGTPDTFKTFQLEGIHPVDAANVTTGTGQGNESGLGYETGIAVFSGEISPFKWWGVEHKLESNGYKLVGWSPPGTWFWSSSVSVAGLQAPTGSRE